MDGAASPAASLAALIRPGRHVVAVDPLGWGPGPAWDLHGARG